MSPQTPTEMGLLIELCRYYCLADQHLPRTLPPVDRAVALAGLGFRHCHPDGARPQPVRLEALGKAFGDWRIRPLPVRRRELLLFVTGAALAWLETRPEDARQLLEQALTISAMVSQRSQWEPWEGPKPDEIARRRLFEVPHIPSESGDEPDPSGDPLEAQGPHTVEAAHARGATLADFASAAQILDGLNHWEAVVQDHLGLELGIFAKTGRPDLERLVERAWTVALPPEVIDVFWERAA